MSAVGYFSDCMLLLVISFSTMSLAPSNLPLVKKALHVPPLEDISKVLTKALQGNFEEVDVEVVECPDLTQEPFTLASKGLNGKTKLIEIGGVPYLLPLVNREKLYDLKDIVSFLKLDETFIIGAAAGPHPHKGLNCEGIVNLQIKDGVAVQQTRISTVDTKHNEVSVQDILPSNETRVALLGNLFFSEGKTGKVIKIHVKKRTGPSDFITSIRQCIESEYKDHLVGLGGTFLVKEGKVKQHVMRDFSKTPIDTEDKLNNWLKFYNMSAPLIAVGTLINGDGGLDLRVQHFHSFSHHGEAGHYHIDTTPDTVEYLGYFNTAEEIIRIDAPKDTHSFGRD